MIQSTQRKIQPNNYGSVVSRYNSGESCATISNTYGCSNETVRRVLLKEDVIIRHGSDSHLNKHAINDNCFNELDELSAYWAGFLMADGHIDKRSETSYGIGIMLSIRDIDHLYKFKQFLATTAPVSVCNNSKFCRIRVSSTEIGTRLEELGITSKKTFTAKACSILKYNKHFWRGMVDGDGTLGLYKIKGRRGLEPRLGLVGTKEILEQFKDFCIRSGVKTGANVIPTRSIYQFMLTCRQAEAVVKLLYVDSNISLARKNEKAKQILCKNL